MESGYNVFSSIEFVVYGIIILDRCKSSLYRKVRMDSFNYDEGDMFKVEFINCF